MSLCDNSLLTNGSTLNGTAALRGWGRGCGGRGVRVGPHTQSTILMPQHSLAVDGKVCCSPNAGAAQLHLCANSYAAACMQPSLLLAVMGFGATSIMCQWTFMTVLLVLASANSESLIGCTCVRSLMDRIQVCRPKPSGYQACLALIQNAIQHLLT